jgi:hypothetical protein
MLLSSFDACRPASLPNSSPIHIAIRQSTRARPIRSVASYGTDSRPRRSASPAVKRRRTSCPPRRLSISKLDLPSRVVGEYPHKDLIGIHPGTLPTEVTPLLHPPCRRDTEGREGLETIEESQWSMFAEELGTLLKYTGPILGSVFLFLHLFNRHSYHNSSAEPISRNIFCLLSPSYVSVITRQRLSLRSPSDPCSPRLLASRLFRAS